VHGERLVHSSVCEEERDDLGRRAERGGLDELMSDLLEDLDGEGTAMGEGDGHGRGRRGGLEVSRPSWSLKQVWVDKYRRGRRNEDGN
jgi:hypothetical protein